MAESLLNKGNQLKAHNLHLCALKGVELLDNWETADEEPISCPSGPFALVVIADRLYQCLDRNRCAHLRNTSLFCHQLATKAPAGWTKEPHSRQHEARKPGNGTDVQVHIGVIV
jgi:hypothetical protein